MKVILSRKGFDDSTGGFASPIMPSGQLLSLPIPVKKKGEKGISYDKLIFNEQPVSEIIQQLSNGRFNCKQQAHLDPDLDRERYKRVQGWRPVFGQQNGAQTYLENRGVKEGDLFLFFGWFKQAKYNDNGELKYVRGAKNLHGIFGWLQIDKILDVEKDKIPDWLDYHLHVVNSKIYTNNKIYIAKRHLTLDGLSHKDGGGVFPKFKPPLQLTAQGEKARSHWSLPKWLIEGAWECRDGHLPFLSGGRQQEFVFDLPDKNIPKLIAWLKELLEDC